MTKPVAERYILVVDDEPAVNASIKMMLGEIGHHVDSAGNATEALSLFRVGKYSVVFTDYNMPDMKGDVLAKRLKSMDPKQPVVMITAHPFVPVPEIDLVIPKPFTFAALCEAVTRFCPPEGVGAGR